MEGEWSPPLSLAPPPTAHALDCNRRIHCLQLGLCRRGVDQSSFPLPSNFPSSTSICQGDTLSMSVEIDPAIAISRGTLQHWIAISIHISYYHKALPDVVRPGTVEIDPACVDHSSVEIDPDNAHATPHQTIILLSLACQLDLLGTPLHPIIIP